VIYLELEQIGKEMQKTTGAESISKSQQKLVFCRDFRNHATLSGFVFKALSCFWR